MRECAIIISLLSIHTPVFLKLLVDIMKLKEGGEKEGERERGGEKGRRRKGGGKREERGRRREGGGERGRGREG